MQKMMRHETKRYILPDWRKYDIKYLILFIISLFQRLFYRFLFLFFVRGKKNKQYAYELAIAAIFKDEAPYLKEWIEYHKLVGVDHIFLYNNGSGDNYEEVLAPYIQEGYVTLIPFPGAQMQMKAYYDCIEKHRETCHWIALIDIDEFLVPRHMDDMKLFLKKFKNRPVVKLNWNVFGTSGRLNRNRDSLVTEDFTVCWKKIDMVGKCILNNDFYINTGSSLNRLIHHTMWGEWHGISLPPVNCFDHICLGDREWAGTDDFPVIINHYFTKSYEEYVEKRSKGDVFFKVNPHTLEFLWAHERNCLKADYSIYRFLYRLKLAMERNEDAEGAEQ